MGPQEQIAQRGDSKVALSFGALAANPGLAQYLEYGLVLLVKPCLSDLAPGEQTLALVAATQAPRLDQRSQLRVAPFIGKLDPGK